MPATIEETLGFARESLGIEQPVADLIYRNSFPLLVQDVTLAMVVDKEIIDGVAHSFAVQPTWCRLSGVGD